MFYALQIALNMSMPTLDHTPDKRGIVLVRGLLTTRALKQAPKGHKTFPAQGHKTFLLDFTG